MLFWTILCNFWCPAVTLATFSSNLSNFKRNPPPLIKSIKKPKIKNGQKNTKILKNLEKKLKKSHFFKKKLKILKYFLQKKNPIPLVLLNEKISLQPELSSPLRFRIQLVVPWALQRTKNKQTNKQTNKRKSLCLILDVLIRLESEGHCSWF